MRRQRIQIGSAIAITVLTQALLFAHYCDLPLMGWDTYPQIAAARIENWADLLGTFTEDTANGVYAYSFYRPVFNLSLALDHAIWGIHPFGYHLADAILTGLVALSLFALARRLLGEDSPVGAFATLVVFVMLPVHNEIAPIISRRMDLFCLLFVNLALYTQMRAPIGSAVLARALPALFTLLAVGSKEAGVVAAPLIFLHRLAADGAVPLGPRIVRAARDTAPHLSAIGLVFAARIAALGILGGHETTDLGGALTRFPWALGVMLGRLSAVMPAELGRSDGAWIDWVGFPGAILLIGVVVRSILFPAAAASGCSSNQRRGSWRTMLSIGSGLLLSIAAVYGASGKINTWHLLLPAAALVIMVGAAAEGLARMYSTGARHGALAGAALLFLLVLPSLLDSPLVDRPRHWQRAGEETQAYLDRLSARIEGSSPGQTITIEPPLNFMDADPNHIGLLRITPLAIYSLPSWAALRHPERRVEFRHPTLDPPGPDEVAREADEDPLVVLVVDE